MLEHTKCFLCKSYLFDKDDITDEEAKELFEEHMSEEHQSFYGNDFLFFASFLNCKERVELVKSENKAEVETTQQSNISDESHEGEIKEEREDDEVKTIRPNDENMDENMQLQGYSGYKCTICFKSSKNFDSIRTHMKTSHPEDWFQCKQCVRKFRILSTLEDHVKSIHTDEVQRRKNPIPHKCPICGIWCTRKWTLKNHIKTHDDQLHFTCEHCNLTVASDGGVQKHKKTQRKCNVCLLVICFKRHFQKHMQTHTGEVKLECQACKQTFNILKDLRHHERSHDGMVEKPYSCVNCQKVFIAEMSATQCQRIHTEKFKCKVCLLSYGTNAELKRHRETHDADRKMFRCVQCPVELVSRPALKLHIEKLHKPGKIFIVCEICGGHVSG